MASQTDLDQGGTARQWEKRWLGPSVGWVWVPVVNTLFVNTTGTTTPVVGTTLITLGANGLTTIQLWDPLVPSTPPANSMPFPSVVIPLTIVDIVGHCGDFPCTILPAVGRTISGLSSIQIAGAFGGYILRPGLSTGDWSLMP